MRSVFGTAAASAALSHSFFLCTKSGGEFDSQKGNVARNGVTFSQSLPVPLMRRCADPPRWRSDCSCISGWGKKVERWEGGKGCQATGESKMMHAPSFCLFSAIVQPKAKLGLLKLKGEKRLEYVSVIRNEKRCVHSSSIHPEV